MPKALYTNKCSLPYRLHHAHAHTLQVGVDTGTALVSRFGQRRDKRNLRGILPVVHATSKTPCTTPRTTMSPQPADTPPSKMHLSSLIRSPQQDSVYTLMGCLLFGRCISRGRSPTATKFQHTWQTRPHNNQSTCYLLWVDSFRHIPTNASAHHSAATKRHRGSG